MHAECEQRAGREHEAVEIHRHLMWIEHRQEHDGRQPSSQGRDDQFERD